MFYGNKVKTENNLTVSCDWLEFTMKEGFDETSPAPYLYALELMGYESEEFDLPTFGGNGYRNKIVRKLNTGVIKVYFHGAISGMGIHVSISGQCLDDVLEHFRNDNCAETPFSGSAYEMDDFDSTVFLDLLKMISRLGRVTRLDIALDDMGAQYFTVSEFNRYLDAGQYSSRIRCRKVTISHESGALSGETVNLGNRSSDFMLRVYNKQLEQNNKRSYSGVPLIETSWVRWEMELKGAAACVACDELVSRRSLAAVFAGILASKLRLIELDNVRKSRCSTLKRWEEFLCDAEKISIYQKPEVPTIDRACSWLKRQVAPTFAAVLLAFGSVDFVYDLLESGNVRLSPKHMNMIREYSIAAS